MVLKSYENDQDNKILRSALMLRIATLYKSLPFHLMHSVGGYEDISWANSASVALAWLLHSDLFIFLHITVSRAYLQACSTHKDGISLGIHALCKTSWNYRY